MLYLGKLICIYDKKTGSASVPYPVFVDIFLDKRLIVARAKSKAGMYKYMDSFVLETATSTTAEKELDKAIKHVCKLFSIETASKYRAGEYFKKQLYLMLEKYTQTPKEILELMNGKSSETDEMVNSLMNNISPLYNFLKNKITHKVLSNV